MEVQGEKHGFHIRVDGFYFRAERIGENGTSGELQTYSNRIMLFVEFRKRGIGQVEVIGFIFGFFAFCLGASAIARIKVLKREIDALKEQVINLQK